MKVAPATSGEMPRSAKNEEKKTNDDVVTRPVWLLDSPDAQNKRTDEAHFHFSNMYRQLTAFVNDVGLATT